MTGPDFPDASGTAEGEATRRCWVFDASPLIALGKIGLLGLPQALGAERVIPEAVAEEVKAGREGDPARAWLLSGPALPVAPSPLLPVVAEWGLGTGEGAVISFALQNTGCEAVLDERAGRTCARALGLPVRGTLGILVLAKEEGALAEVRPHLDALVQAGYHLGPDLIAAVLAEAGEG